ncbi:MAG: hypothetical protein AAF085_00335 [Planctomycetota bacterium]
MDKQSEVISFLNRLPIEELVQVLEKTFRERDPAPGEEAYYSARYCLAIASREKLGQSDIWESTDIELVAYPDPVKNNGAGPADGLCQSGQCAECGVRVRSNCKHCVCPACSIPVYLT